MTHGSLEDFWGNGVNIHDYNFMSMEVYNVSLDGDWNPLGYYFEIGDKVELSFPCLERVTAMFGNASLTSFTGSLPKLTDGSSMFYNCMDLTTFTSDLPSLTDGSGMFEYCQLNQASVDHILANIKDWSTEGGYHSLSLGVADGVDKRVAAFAAKGWSIN